MNTRFYNILVIVITLLLVGGVYAWFYPLNKGVLTITSGLGDYEILIDKVSTTCAQDPCVFELKTGNHLVEFRKKNYNPAAIEIRIVRGETYPLTLEPKKVITLSPSNVVPKPDRPKLPPPDGVEAESIIASSWNKDQSRFLYLDASDERIKIYDKNTGEMTLVSTLQGLTPPLAFHWSPAGTHIVVTHQSDLYFFDVQMGSRQKIPLPARTTRSDRPARTTRSDRPARTTRSDGPAPAQNLNWSPSNRYFLFNDDEDRVFMINITAPDDPRLLTTAIDLKNSIWLDENTLLYFTYDAEQQLTQIRTLQPETGLAEDLINRFGLQFDEITYDKEARTVYLRNVEGGWYEVEF